MQANLKDIPYQNGYRTLGQSIKTICASNLVLALICGGGMSIAQEAEEAEESNYVFAPIVVTAQKREENIQDVGISITAFDAAQLEALGYTNAQQITALAPGVSTIQPNGESNYSIAMRGAANSDFTTNVESPIALYVDEVYISQSSGSGFLLFDTERVELLRGPQGTLFGRNATGGLVHFITKKPEFEYGGYGTVSYGSFNTLALEGAVNVPFSDSVAARLSVATEQGDGYVENRLRPDEKLNNSNDQGARLQLFAKPSDNFDVLFNVRYGSQDIRTGFFEYVGAVNPTGSPQPTVPNPQLDGYVDLDGDVYAGAYDFRGRNDLETFGASATAHWTFGDTTLTSITDVQTVERDYIEDSDASPTNFFNFFLTTNAEQFSQEFRLNGKAGALNWVVGAYYLDIDIDDSNGGIAPGFLDTFFGLVDPASIGAANGIRNPYTQESKSISAFAQADYPLGEQFNITGGFRFINEEKSFEYANELVLFPETAVTGLNAQTALIADLVEPFSGNQEDDLWSARLQLDYTPTDDFLAYVSWNRGVRAGGFNAPLLPTFTLATEDFLQYDPETLDAYEIGIKWEMPQLRSRLNASTYYYDYKDYQVFSIIGLDTFTLNGNAENYGFEVELQTSPLDGLDMLVGVGHINSTVTDVPGVTEDIVAPGVGTISAFLDEAQPVQTPEWEVSALARYEFPIDALKGRMALQADASYRSEHFFNLTQLPAATEDGYTITNASISWTPNEADWEFRLAVNNLTDEEYLVQTFDLSGTLELGGFFGLIEQYYGRPRTWTASLNYKF